MNEHLVVNNLTASIENTIVLSNVSFEAKLGNSYVIMGPNGSGKSSLAHTLMGHPSYHIHCGSILFEGNDFIAVPMHKRAQRGFFLTNQNPPSIPGLTLFRLLMHMHRHRFGSDIELDVFRKKILEYCLLLSLPETFLERSLHDGFSGGEKKRAELLMMLVMEPTVAILDEIDSGLDVEGLKITTRIIEYMREKNPSIIFFIITHSLALARHLSVNEFFIINKGNLTVYTDASLLDRVEKYGYASLF